MKHTGACHCGEVKFEAEMTIERVLSCNCSICQKRGHLLAFVPDANFKLLSGEDFLSDYQFGKKRIHHLFCKNCGISIFSKSTAPDGTPMRAINVRCVDDLDFEKLPVDNYNGKDL